MPQLAFTAKEIHILVQLIAAMMDAELAFDYAKRSELDALRSKLQNVKGV